MSKRANGEGTVHQRKDGRWQASFTLRDQAKRRTVYGRTQGEALARMKALQDQARRGVDVSARPATLATYGDQWLKITKGGDVEAGRNSANTIRNYRHLWDRHIAPELGHLRLDVLSPAHIREWQSKKLKEVSVRGKPLSPRTVQFLHGLLRTALNDAYRDGLIDHNPVERVRPPRPGKSPARPLTNDELRGLRSELAGTCLEAPVLLMVATGARAGEALGMHWSDVDLDTATWHVSRSLGRCGDPNGTGPTRLDTRATTKTEASKATVTLPAVVVAELRRHKSLQAAQRMASETWANPELAFTTPLGTPLEPRNVLRLVKAAALRAGIEHNVRLHDLRHTAATFLLEDGVPIEVTSKLLRHTRLSTTVDLYGHLTEKLRIEAAASMDRRLTRAAE